MNNNVNKTIFPTPQSLNLFPDAAYNRAVVAVRDHINRTNFKFQPNYDLTRFKNQLKGDLNESGWVLNEIVENNVTYWKLEPK